MFEYLKPYTHILVSGMQRSGTTIAARMIQYDLDILNCYWVGNEIERLQEHPEGDRGVYHAPALSHMLHKFKSPSPDITFAVVWVKRDEDQILKSAQEAKWIPTAEIENYKDAFPKDQELDYDTVVRRLTKAKNEFWKIQKDQVENPFEIEYESLRSHPLWLEDRPFKKDRRATSPGTVTGETKEYSVHTSPLYDLLKEFPKEGQKKEDLGGWTPPWAK